MTQPVKILYRNILENSTVVVTSENASFPKYRLYDRDIGKLFKGASTPAEFYITLDQGASLSYPVDRLIIPAGHNFNGRGLRIQYSNDNFAGDVHTVREWTQDGNGLINVCTMEEVLNPGFEFGNPLAHWTASGTPELVERASLEKAAGAFSAHIVDSTPSTGGIVQALGAMAAGACVISYRYLVKSGTMRAQLDATGFQQTHTASSRWRVFEGTYTFTDSDHNLYFVNNSGASPAEFYVDSVSVRSAAATAITSRYWRLAVIAPVAAPEVPELFLGETVAFERPPSWGFEEEDQFNVGREESGSGKTYFTKFGEKRFHRAYTLAKVSDLQKANFEAWDRHAERCKPVYVEDATGNVFFAEILNGVRFRSESQGRWGCNLELLEVLP